MSKMNIFPLSGVHFADVNVLTAQRHTSIKILRQRFAACFLYQWLSKITLRKPFVIQIAYPFRTVNLVIKLVQKLKICNLKDISC